MRSLNTNFPKRLAIFFAVLYLFSCTDDSSLKRKDVDNLISKDNATELATTMSFASNASTDLNGRNNGPLMQKNIKHLKSFNDDNNEPLFYLINYEESGFVIMAADNRALPILAHSDSDVFFEDENSYPSGLVDWLTYARSYIKSIRNSKKKQSETEAQMWAVCSVQSLVFPGDGDCGGTGGTGGDCQDTYEVVGPLLQTTWGQGCGYNNLTPYCTDASYCNRAPTGCVATAMAQVMRYHKFPAIYNWNIMPNAPGPFFRSYSTGAAEISQVMKDVGDNVAMSYGCNGSAADTKSKVASAFVNGFGYASATYRDYQGTTNYELVKDNFRNLKPVIFRGGENTGWWIFNRYSNGHAWVGDGLMANYSCGTGTSSLYFHMNWGWDNSGNGWFAFNNFNPTVGANTYTFNYKSGVVLNIIP